MDSALLEKLELIAAAGIRLIPAPEVATHFLFERDGFVVLVERRAGGFGAAGSPGRLTREGGFAALVRRGDAEYFVGKGGEEPAAPEQAALARRLFQDLRTILG